MMGKKLLFILIIFVLIIVNIIIFYYNQELYSKFSYKINVKENLAEKDNYIKIEGNKVFIRQNFFKPDPCYKIKYQISNKNHTINLIQENFSIDNSCITVAVIAYDTVDLNLTLDKNYTFNMYSLWNKEEPFISKELIIGDNETSYNKCVNETYVPGRYKEGDIIVDIKPGTNERDIQELE